MVLLLLPAQDSPCAVVAYAANLRILVLCWRYGFVYTQEEEFADTGYQIAPSDPGTASTTLPVGVQQLGALTAEDFNRKSGALKEDARCVVCTRMMLPGRFRCPSRVTTVTGPPPRIYQFKAFRANLIAPVEITEPHLK